MWGKGESVALAASEADAQARYNEIVDLLVAAGYHRARISALSPFDKVVGGMAWCMTATSVDVDIAFLENATIGQKIKIGEGIERALKFMKCRIPLQAHQVQGLDFAAIFPVVQWLVKQAYTFREEIADATRRMSASAFKRHFSLPADSCMSENRKVTIPTGQLICSCYAPARRYRPKSLTSVHSADLHARRVLMEFGTQIHALTAGQKASGEAGVGQDKDAGFVTNDEKTRSTQELEDEMTNMAETSQDAEQAVSQGRIVSTCFLLSHAPRPSFSVSCMTKGISFRAFRLLCTG